MKNRQAIWTIHIDAVLLRGLLKVDENKEREAQKDNSMIVT